MKIRIKTLKSVEYEIDIQNMNADPEYDELMF